MNKKRRITQAIKIVTRWLPGAVVLVVVAAFMMVAVPAKKSAAAPYLGCSPNGYIVKDNGSHTDIQAIDMVTGAGSSAGQVQNHKLNAIGYNPIDNHFYAWDLQNGVYVKLDANFNVTATFTPTNIGLPGLTTSDIFAGDVDEDGYHWFFRVGGTTTWYRVNTNTPTPTFVESGSTANPAGSEGTDWAYIPGTDSLYRGMDNGTDITIVAFNRTSKTYSTVGTVTNITAGGAPGRNMGAVYADPDGNFYMSSNGSGVLWRVDLSNPSGPGPTFTAVQLDAADVGSNDGARCVLASVPTDYGDAPAGYDTAIEDDGPRHSVISFNIAGSTAPLMLGRNIDIENDGFPSAAATGDDDDHEGAPGGPNVDDERGIQHIVATPGSSTPLTVPAFVTNSTAQAATLVGWIDLDNDGTFEVSERVSVNVPAGFVGYQQLTFPAPPAPYSVNTFARFRLFAASDTSAAASGLLPTSPATGGEVEDVLVQVGSYDVSKTADPAEGSSVNSGNTVTYTITIENTGLTALTNLKIDDDLTDVLDDATVEGTPIVNPVPAGTASVTGNTLEFVGDVGIGGTVTVTYTVKVKTSATLGNAALNNYVLATHSTSCHPVVSGGSATVSDPDCKTNHVLGGLSNTGLSIFTPLMLSGGLLVVAGAAAWYLTTRRYRYFRR